MRCVVSYSQGWLRRRRPKGAWYKALGISYLSWRRLPCMSNTDGSTAPKILLRHVYFGWATSFTFLFNTISLGFRCLVIWLDRVVAYHPSKDHRKVSTSAIFRPEHVSRSACVPNPQGTADTKSFIQVYNWRGRKLYTRKGIRSWPSKNVMSTTVQCIPRQCLCGSRTKHQGADIDWWTSPEAWVCGGICVGVHVIVPMDR